jgi:hypothetical protein
MSLHDVDSTDLAWLENMLLCKIESKSIRSQIQPSPIYGKSEYASTHVINHEQEYTLRILSRDLEFLIRKLKEIDRHEQAQQRWPHLKQAYLEYITQVQLTV